MTILKILTIPDPRLKHKSSNIEVFDEKLKKLFDVKDGAFAHDFIARTRHPLSLNSYKRRGGKLPRKLPSFKSKDIFPGDKKDRILCVFDDRTKVVNMWRDNGLSCFQVAPGDF